MMGRMTLREVREALAAAKAKATRAAATAPTVEELESLARLLEQEAQAEAPPEEPHLKEPAAPGAAPDNPRESR